MEVLVKNAASKKQVKESSKKVLSRRDKELNDIRVVMNNEFGRRFLWRLLSECKTFGSVWNENTHRIAYNAGRQDLGHKFMADAAEAHPEWYQLMVDENKETS